jgi:hypothetical protein
MLSNLSTNQKYNSELSPVFSRPQVESRYNRNEEADMQKAIGYLYDFKKKLDDLHPNCLNLIENMLQKHTHNRY